jgi:hypothetical protein
MVNFEEFRSVSVKEIRDFYVTLIKTKITDIKKSSKEQLLTEISANSELMDSLRDWCKDDSSKDEANEPAPTPIHSPEPTPVAVQEKQKKNRKVELPK